MKRKKKNSTFDSVNCLIKFNLMQIIQVVEIKAMRFYSLIMLIHFVVVYPVYCVYCDDSVYAIHIKYLVNRKSNLYNVLLTTGKK